MPMPVPFFPPLTAMLSSASTDLAKTWLDTNGWPQAFELLRKHNLVPTSGWGKRASALGLMVMNGFVDWYHAEDTLVARFTKDILRDIPSEVMSRLWEASPAPSELSPAPTANQRPHNPVFDLAPDELTLFLASVRTLDHAAQGRLRILMSKLQSPEMKTVAATNAVDMATLVDLLMPPPPPKPDRRPLGDRIKTGLNGLAEELADFLAPGMGR